MKKQIYALTVKSICTIFISVFSISFIGCKNEGNAGNNQSQTNNTNTPANNNENNTQQNSGIAVDFIKTFEGKINNKFPITFKITANNGQITGTYFYNKVGKDLKLKGTIDKDGNISLTEYDEKGNSTGLFKGSTKNNNKIEGNWSKPDGSSSMPFYLIESNTSYNTAQKESQDNATVASFKGKWSSEEDVHIDGLLELVLEQEKNDVNGTLKYESFDGSYKSGITTVIGKVNGNKCDINIINSNGKVIGKASLTRDGKILRYKSTNSSVFPESTLLFNDPSISH